VPSPSVRYPCIGTITVRILPYFKKILICVVLQSGVLMKVILIRVVLMILILMSNVLMNVIFLYVILLSFILQWSVLMNVI